MTAAAFVALSAPFAGSASATTLLPEYMIIATSPGSEGHALDLQDSELGAISREQDGDPLRFNNVSPPQGNRAFPSGTRGPELGVITLDGDVAITDRTGTVTLSNTDVHSESAGPGSPGSQGIDCANSFAGCSDNGQEISTSNPLGPDEDGSGFNTTPLPGGPSFTQIANNNGIQGDVSLGGLVDDLVDFRSEVAAFTADQTLNLAGLNNEDRTFTFGSGLTVVDINTGGNDFDLSNANFIVEGEADSSVIFRIEAEQALVASNSNFLLAGAIGLSNVLFFVDDDSSSFNFDNVEFFGFSFFDYLGLSQTNDAVFNNVRGCGQLVTDQVKFNNVSMTNCAYNPELSVVPLPAALPLLGTALIMLGALRMRGRRNA